jgi:hypothetical protein
MSANIDDLLPTAKEIHRRAALQAAEKAEEYARLQATVGAEKRKFTRCAPITAALSISRSQAGKRRSRE